MLCLIALPNNINLDRILSVPDNIFKSFVQLLDANLGFLLCPMSTIVDDIVIGMFERTLDRSKSFAIERLKSDKIIEYPRDSPELLQLMSAPVNYKV